MKILWDNLFKKNPVFVLMLGLVPAVAVTDSAWNGWVLGLITAAVFTLAAACEHLLAPLAPVNARPKIKVAILIVLTAAAHGLLFNWRPQTAAELGIFLPLIAVNSMLLQPRNEGDAFGPAVLKALTQGLGFTLALVLIGVIREFLGFGTVFGIAAAEAALPPLALASGVPGGMIIVGLLMGLVNGLAEQRGGSHE